MSDLTGFEASILREVAETVHRIGDLNHSVSSRAIALEIYKQSPTGGQVGAVTRATNRLVNKGYLKPDYSDVEVWRKHCMKLSHRGKEWAREQRILDCKEVNHD